MDDWRWSSEGLYDGDVPIVWAARDHHDNLYVGVMADWESALANVPQLLQGLKEALGFIGGVCGAIVESAGEEEAERIIEETGTRELYQRLESIIVAAEGRDLPCEF